MFQKKMLLFVLVIVLLFGTIACGTEKKTQPEVSEPED
jgi:hypothetical protein